MKLQDIHTLVVHCTATRAGEWIDAAWIDAEHRKRNHPFRKIGYHRVIRLDGSVEQGREFTEQGAHVAGNNENTIGVVLVGGLDMYGKPADTFEYDQYNALFGEIHSATLMMPNLKTVCGHRDYSPDLNSDGIITPNEWIKVCPCFDVNEKLDLWGLGHLKRVV